MLEVVEAGFPLRYDVADLMLYHGPGSPAGVAHAVKVLELALPLLGGGAPVERREVRVTTPFAGPGARDAFEMVTRAVTEGRYVVDPALARPERGPTLESFVFHLAYRGRAVTLVLRDAGHVSDEFVRLARAERRTAQEDERLTALKADMARRLLALPAAEVYDVEVPA